MSPRHAFLIAAGVLGVSLVVLAAIPVDEPAGPAAPPGAAPINPAGAIEVVPPITAAVPPMPAPTPTATGGGTPGFEIDTEYYDFGKIWDHGTQNGVYHFTNTGTGTLRILSVKPGCGCTTTSLAKYTYEPGESGRIDFQFDPLGTGRQTKGITILTNAPGKEELKVRLSADISPLVVVEPRYMRLDGVDLGKPRRTSFTMTPVDPSFEVTSVTSSGTGADHVAGRVMAEGEERITFDGSVRVVAAGEHAIEVTVLPTAPWGGLYAAIDVHGRIRIPETGELIDHVAKMNVMANVWGELSANDNMFRVQVVKPGAPIRATLRLERRDGVPYRVNRISIEGARPASLEVTALPVPGTDGSAWELVVAGDSGTHLGQVSANVVIETDVPGEERVEFKVAGIVRDVAAATGH